MKPCMLDISRALVDGNKGLSIWATDDGYQVSVKRRDTGAFVVGYGASPAQALDDALGVKDDFEDLL